MDKILKRASKSITQEVLGNLFRLIINKPKIKKSLTAFCYHDVSDNPSEFSQDYYLNVPPDTFEYQIDFINKNFNVISADDLLAGKIPENAALITFDDGFRSYFTTAVPILEKYNSPSINFLNMAPIKGDIFWSGLITFLCNKSTDFHRHIANSTDINLKIKPLFLHCTREIVDTFLKVKDKSYKDEVQKFVGDFATEKDLEYVSTKNLVFFGNHLFNHYISLYLSERELLESFGENKDELKKYPNYRNLFAFPFGQPNTCFSNRQIDILLKNGAKKVFSTYPVVNQDISSPYLHRIPLFSYNNTKARIWFNILRQSFNI